MGLPTDIRVVDAQPYFRVEGTHHGLTFGRQRSDDLTLCHVGVRVETRSGRQGAGWGAVFLSHQWAMPQVGLHGESRDRLMRRLVEAFCEIARSYREFGHPLQLFLDLMPAWRRQSHLITQAWHLEDVPHLAELVCASPLDAAIHDGFGVANGLPTYLAYGPDHCAHDLEAVDPGLRGQYVADYLRQPGRRTVVVAHTVGLRDPLSVADQDGTSVSPLSRWIEEDGVHCFKVKVGQSVTWDAKRLANVYGVAKATLPAARRGLVTLSADYNGEAPSADSVVETLALLQQSSPGAYAALDFIEQPTSSRAPLADVTAIARRKPVVLDESFTDLESLREGRALGWSGIALKTCKCQSLSLLANAEATHLGMRCTVPDLSNPGIALLQSVSLASHLSQHTTLEANGRQYYPEASLAEAKVHPGLFDVKDGALVTTSLTGPGFGYRLGEIDRDLFHATASGRRDR